MRVNLFLIFLVCSLFSQEEIAKTELPASPQEEVSIAFPLSLMPKSSPPAPAQQGAQQQESYTINYTTVPIIEYIKFASKICKVNFIYNEADLIFTITVVSDEPITPKNVMATLVQVLRIHNLEILEQDNNLVIHQSPNVRQLATLVTDNQPDGTAPIVTRIFRVKNAKPDAIAAVIRPMISASALLETLPDTRQLILTDVTANVDKVAALIENLDSPYTLLDIQSFEARNNSPDLLVSLASQIMSPIAQGNPFILVPQPLANSIFIVSTPELVQKAIAVFTTLDTPPKKEVISERKLRAENVFVYKVMNRSGDDVLKGLMSIAADLQHSGVAEPDLITTLDTAKWLPDSNSIMIMGSTDSINKTKEFLAALDVAQSATTYGASFFVYKPVNRSATDVQKAILEMAKNLSGTKGADPSLIETIDSVKVNPSTNTLVFSGDQKNFPRIRDILSSIDVSTGKAKAPIANNFFIYKIQTANPLDLQTSLKNFARTLDKTNAADKGLIDAINQMKYMKENNSILFTGPDSELKRLESLLPNFDSGTGQIPASSQFFIYKPQHETGDHLVKSLKDIEANLKADQLADPALLHALDSMKWVKSTNSLIFTGDPDSLKKIESLISTIDVAKNVTKPGFYIYKVQHTTGDVIEEDLDAFAKNLKASGVKDPVLEIIAKMRYVKETNSLILSGDPTAIEQVKTLITQYDYPRAATPTSSNFFMYKPQHVSAMQIEKSLQDVAANLKKANLADPNFLQSIDTMKYVESTNSLIFTGSPDAIQKIQSLLTSIDIPPTTHTPIQHVGKTTFLLYKLKYASGPQIVASLKSMANDLKKSSSDKDLVNALNTMKYVKETNSLFFTGTQEALTKVQALVTQFDVAGLAAPAPAAGVPEATNFFVYRPQSVPGPELEKIVTDFGNNLKTSGLIDQELFNAIASTRWDEKTKTLVFTGTPKALDQVKELLVEFDIPTAGPAPKTPLEPSISAIDNVSFLVYKLQFHKGDEIQAALRQIAKDLMQNNANVNKNLLNTIQSIQWLQVTNSLLAQGDQETITRMRELIKNLDVPLKQVFIEVLVIETTLTNALSFGLEWSANYQYRNKFASTTSNTAPSSSSTGGSNAATYAPDSLMQGMQNISPTQTPSINTQPGLPLSGTGAFDLGVIGEVIRHKGQTFLTLGSLLSALQTDAETNVVDSPKILTQDGRTSTIFVGENIPFVGSFVSNTSQNTIQSTNIEYRDIGLNLTITPVLGNSDIVTLDISLDRSQTLTTVTQTTIQNNSSANGIVTSKTTMDTTVHVPDNNFLILSGAVLNSTSKFKTGLPCLGGLPMVGALFSSSNDVVTNTNLVIFLRPHIINSLDDIRTISHEQEEFFRDQAGTPYLERAFDDGMEMIKTPDDE